MTPRTATSPLIIRFLSDGIPVTIIINIFYKRDGVDYFGNMVHCIYCFHLLTTWEMGCLCSRLVWRTLFCCFQPSSVSQMFSQQSWFWTLFFFFFLMICLINCPILLPPRHLDHISAAVQHIRKAKEILAVTHGRAVWGADAAVYIPYHNNGFPVIQYKKCCFF